MVTILPQEDQFGDIGKAIGQGFKSSFEQAKENRLSIQEDSALQSLMGSLPENATGTDIVKAIMGAKVRPEAKKRAFENFVGAEKIDNERKKIIEEKRHNEASEDISREKGTASSSKEKEKQQSLQGALETVGRMRAIRKKGNLGWYSSGKKLISPETRRDVGEYQRLGKSLIALASTIPIRNQKEFDVLSGDLFDSSITDAEAAGILDGMERILKNSLKGEEEVIEKDSKGRPPLSSFEKG